MTDTPKALVRNHYFLGVGEIEYREDKEAPVKTMLVDMIFTWPTRDLQVRAMAKIQESLQMRFHAKYSKSHPAPPEITDVVILNIAHLGHFTSEEFQDQNTPPTKA